MFNVVACCFFCTVSCGELHIATLHHSRHGFNVADPRRFAATRRRQDQRNQTLEQPEPEGITDAVQPPALRRVGHGSGGFIGF